MSGCSYDNKCPNCQNTVSEYSDHKPFSIVSIGPCLECGFYTDTLVKYLTLEELNSAREDHNVDYEYDEFDEEHLSAFAELPKQDEM